MDKNRGRARHIRNLDLHAFREYPVWTWYDNDPDTSLVIPVELTDPLNDEEYLAFFMLVTFVLRDQTSLQGSVSIDLLNHSVYTAAFFKDDEEFIYSGSLFPYEGTLQHLADWLNKSPDDITPLKYETPYQYQDGVPIQGEIEL
jgi:hypothetical protein